MRLVPSFLFLCSRGHPALTYDVPDQLPLTHLLGMDPSSYLAFLVPDELLMFR